MDAKLVEATILDPDALDAAFDGASAVVHLGARPSVPRSVADPVASHDANATGTMNVLEAARSGRQRTGGGRLVVLGIRLQPRPSPSTRTSLPRPMSPYAASKLATESYAARLAALLRDGRRSPSDSSTCSARSRPPATPTPR
ncbi:MAG: NAD-dependent epimerase/dehydratase family protein [Microthrixaceae bacterium]